MRTISVLKYLRAPTRRSARERCGVRNCLTWYPIENELLELLAGELSYLKDRESFWNRHRAALENLGLGPPLTSSRTGSATLQTAQQQHFDWYATNNVQTYSEYEKSPFWLAVDQLTFDNWLREVQPGKWLLDVGCAQGRSTWRFMQADLNILGFDVSKRLIRQAIDRYRNGAVRSKCTFFVADGTRFPLIDSSIDYVLIYGVLHHLPDPGKACRETARVLKHQGIYFGSENNATIFRKLFDVLQKIFPQWHEEAGPEPLISRQRLSEAFREARTSLTTNTSVFVPPHLLNLMPERIAYRALLFSDRLGNLLPVVRDNGGLLLIRAVRDRLGEQEQAMRASNSQ